MSIKSSKNHNKSASNILMVISIVWILAAMLLIAILRIEDILMEITFLFAGSIGLSWSIYAKSYEGSIKYLMILIFGVLITIVSYLLLAFIYLQINGI
jgi:hypothetical protein